jgi:ribonucleoside-diphosphate reductase alpha chain
MSPTPHIFAPNANPSNGLAPDYGRDALLTDFGIATLKDRYLVDGETSPQDAFMRAAKAFADNDEHAQRLYDYASKLWFMFSTPILSNGGTTRGLPISCFLSHVGDSRRGLTGHYTENAWLSSVGGGIGSYWGAVRSNGTRTSGGSQSSGIIPFLKVVDSEVLAFAQGVTRRASYAAYLDIGHPEIVEFLEMRKPTGGDANRKCLNLHNAVNIPDSFMQILERCMKDPSADDSWPLIDPKTQAVIETVSARDLWQRLLELRVQTGEPYLHFIDASNRALPQQQKDAGLKVTTSNLCVAPETLVLTDRGHLPIASLAGQKVNVWNGKEWSGVDIVKTGENQALVSVLLSNGETIECTPYHKFYVTTGFAKSAVDEVRAGDLKPGMKLVKFDLPVIDGPEAFPYAYTHGFFCGDGTYGGKRADKPQVAVYPGKHGVVPQLSVASGSGVPDAIGRLNFRLPADLAPKFMVPSAQHTITSRLAWFAGLCDADGCVARNGDTESLQVSSIKFEFLMEVRRMLQTLGVEAKVTLMHEARVAKLPDGRGGYVDTECQAVYRLLLGNGGSNKLVALGFSPERLELGGNVPNRDASHFVTVVGVQDTGRIDDTYCFTEPKRHMGVFNGVLTGQCSEITLPTSEERTAVCCLSSVNLEFFDEWKDNPLFIDDLVRMLDNVLQSFIDNAPDEIHRARYSAMMERSIGLGAMGFHSYLQRKRIPFESALATSVNRRMFKLIKTQAKAATTKLAEERGPCPDAQGAMIRNMHLLAIAPNASSSIICGGTSPSIEPNRANAFTHKTQSGSWLVKNKYLAEVLADYDRNDEATWKSIILAKGSVQHLDFLTDEKDVFKTGMELDQRWLIEHAAHRQEFICQAQSLNLFFTANSNIAYLHHVHFRAWKAGLKTLYYLRSEALSRADAVSVKLTREQITNTEDVCLSCQG